MPERADCVRRSGFLFSYLFGKPNPVKLYKKAQVNGGQAKTEWVDEAAISQLTTTPSIAIITPELNALMLWCGYPQSFDNNLFVRSVPRSPDSANCFVYRPANRDSAK